MSDIVDEANNLVEESIARTLSSMRLPDRIGNKYCDDCDIRIPDTRRLAVMGCTRCVDCQQIYESKQR